MKIVRIGRSRGNDINLPADDLTASKYHCQIIQEDDGSYTLVDVGSTNGTYVNGVKRHGQVKLNRNRSNIMLKRKIEKNLIDLGYHNYLINESLSKINTDDQELYKKEYDKLYKKLSRKYQGKELELKIKQKLYQKGFKSTEY